MRFLIGGFLGAVSGMAAWVLLEYAASREFLWFALVLGLIVGLGVRMTASGQSRIIAGTGAAVLTLASIIGAQVLLILVLSQTGRGGPSAAATPSAGGQAEVSGRDTASAGGVDRDIETDAPARVPLQTDSLFAARSTQDRFSIADLLIYGCSCLLAYVVGASSSPPRRDAATDRGESSEEQHA
jgi:hypothetical protein